MPYSVKGFFEINEDMVQVLLVLEVLFTQDSDIQQNQKAKLDHHMSMLFAGRGLEVLKCFVRGGQIFFCLLCVCGGGDGREVQVQYLYFREKNNRPPPINK